MPDGTTMVCPLHDLSISGGAVLLDKRRAIVVRHHERGIGVEFLNEQFTPGVAG